jgi:hypothetical protein
MCAPRCAAAAAAAALLQNENPPPVVCALVAAAADAAGLLQLAMNCSSLPKATAAFSCLPSQLEPTAARRLLLTAAVRHFGELATRLAAAPAVQRHLDAPTLSLVLRLMLPRASSRPDCVAVARLLREQHTEALQKDWGDLVEVLRAAARSRVGKALFVPLLLQLPNVQQLEGPVVSELLSAVIPSSAELRSLRAARMPDGTHGFGMGRGRPLTLAP